MKGPYVMIAASESTPDMENEYNRWYNDIHLPMLFEYEGLKAAGRYKVDGDSPECSKYLAVYEFETEDAMDGFMTSDAMKRAMADFDRKWENGGFVRNWAGSYQLMKRLER